MTCSLESIAYQFFDEYLDSSRPVLLGLSGGPDSICLLHLLLSWKGSLHLHLVHVDHGWRKESALEAEKLHALATLHGLPFHTTRLRPERYKGNLEMESRKERFAYFRKVEAEVGAQGILLGHHADDQAETVFKRVLEGAALPYLSGMMPVSDIEGLSVMRPLLPATKKEILAWLSTRAISYFHDVTNVDERFLRAKMRVSIFPFLKESFGKGFERNLCELATEARELRCYLDEKLKPLLQKTIASDCGLLFEESAAPFELSYLLRTLCKEQGILTSRSQIALAVEALTNKKAHVQVVTGEKSLVCDRGRAFFMRVPLDDVEGIQPLVIGEQQFGDWKIDVRLVDNAATLSVCNSWRDVWKGSCSTLLPEGEYLLGKAEASKRRHFLSSEKPSKVLNRFLNEKKVPHLFMSKTPVIYSLGNVVEEFLSGTKMERRGRLLYVRMERLTKI